MKYQKILKSTFVERVNRFVAQVSFCDRIETVHIKNTGRCSELFVKGAEVYLLPANNPTRRTKYDLIAVKRITDNEIVNVDSQIPNQLVYEWLYTSDIFSRNAIVQREKSYGTSRFDIYVEDGNRKAFIEVKGVTLEEKGVALFPDAPTERGIKHIAELIKAMENGYEAYIVFVIQMKGVSSFAPNDKTHKAFGDALRLANSKGVKIMALDCIVTPQSIEIDKNIDIIL